MTATCHLRFLLKHCSKRYGVFSYGPKTIEFAQLSFITLGLHAFSITTLQAVKMSCLAFCL